MKDKEQTISSFVWIVQCFLTCQKVPFILVSIGIKIVNRGRISEVKLRLNDLTMWHG